MPNYNEVVRRYEKATEDVREAVEELRLASIAFGYEDGRKDARLREISETIITPEMQVQLWQKKRDEIVAKAKADVEQLKHKEPHEFIVNKSKRTIVALVCDLMNGEVYDRGIAKCDPSDCFNAHIGRAIALRRALDLDIPEDYLTAPQPTKVHEGDEIRLEYAGRTKGKYTAKVKSIGETKVKYESGSFDYVETMDRAEIIDDSRE